VAEEHEAGRGALRGLLDFWQQMASPFGDLRALDDIPSWGPRSGLEALLQTARAGLVGRRVAVGEGEGHVVFTLVSLDARLDPVGGAAGQAEDVKLAAVDVEWSGFRFDEVEAVLGNVHTRLGSRPSLVSAPIELSLSTSGERLTALLARWTPRFAFKFSDSGRVQVQLGKHPAWGWVELQPSVVSGTLEMKPTGLGRGSRGLRLKRSLPTIRRAVPLPEKVRIVDLTVSHDRLEVRIRIDDWRVEYLQVLGMASKPR